MAVLGSLGSWLAWAARRPSLHLRFGRHGGRSSIYGLGGTEAVRPFTAWAARRRFVHLLLEAGSDGGFGRGDRRVSQDGGYMPGALGFFAPGVTALGRGV